MDATNADLPTPLYPLTRTSSFIGHCSSLCRAALARHIFMKLLSLSLPTRRRDPNCNLLIVSSCITSRNPALLFPRQNWPSYYSSTTASPLSILFNFCFFLVVDCRLIVASGVIRAGRFRLDGFTRLV